jgi:2,3-diketo-5-methylthio-1-phosphopentane phosphatase
MSGEFPRVYLLDVEGTVAPISLVSDVLFPYARRHCANFLWDNRDDSAVRADLELLRSENRAEGGPPVPQILYPRVPGADDLSMPDFQLAAMIYIFWLMDRDRKSTALKSLQGKIWKAGFESGELKGALFDDVPDALARWSAVGKVAIYSSGSVEAQRLVFRHSIFGDLTSVISNYFDTRTGAKGEPASYTAIAAAMGVVADEVLFFSDAVRELDAARAAGCDTRLVVREGNAPVEDAHGHAAVESFALI